jgi:hypothetical protein
VEVEDDHTDDDQQQREELHRVEAFTEHECADERDRRGAEPGPHGVRHGDRHLTDHQGEQPDRQGIAAHHHERPGEVVESPRLGQDGGGADLDADGGEQDDERAEHGSHSDW